MPPRLGPPRPFRVFLAVALVIFVLWMVSPALSGYHIGCNALIDHYRLIRLGLEWCR